MQLCGILGVDSGFQGQVQLCGVLGAGAKPNPNPTL